MLAQVAQSLVISTAYLSNAQVFGLQGYGPHPEALESSLLEACIAAEDLSSQCAPQGIRVMYPL